MRGDLTSGTRVRVVLPPYVSETFKMSGCGMKWSITALCYMFLRYYASTPLTHGRCRGRVIAAAHLTLKFAEQINAFPKAARALARTGVMRGRCNMLALLTCTRANIIALTSFVYVHSSGLGIKCRSQLKH
jgi:hypothetical protein